MRTFRALCLLAAVAMSGSSQQPVHPAEGTVPYDASIEETIEAVVSDVTIQTRRAAIGLVTLNVLVQGVEYQLPLAHAYFLNEHKISFSPGDAITIRGIKHETPDGSVINAREVINGESRLVLLDDEGRLLAPQKGKLKERRKFRRKVKKKATVMDPRSSLNPNKHFRPIPAAKRI
jgi:hypothetical protein